MGKFTAEVHVWNTQIVSVLVFSGNHMKRSSSCIYDSFIMAGGMTRDIYSGESLQEFGRFAHKFIKAIIR